ncbi:MAG: hypothetical protein M1831_002629 [Alyxoria varia]|nr:MAG: hypothetical protein M1831_002629 [Alyxoria varia]
MAFSSSSIYGQPRPTKKKPSTLTDSTSSTAFSSAFTSLLSSSTTNNNTNNAASTSTPTTITGGRPRPSRTPKSDIFTTHNRNTKKRAAADMLAHAASPSEQQQHSTTSEALDDGTWKRAKRKMDEKARLYAALKRGDVDDASERYGVDFDRKWMEGRENGEDGAAQHAEEESSSGDDDQGEEPKELVEIVDEFGRTRKVSAKEAAREQRRRARMERVEAEIEGARVRPSAPANVIYGDAVQSTAYNPDAVTEAQMEELAKKRDRSATPPEASRYDSKSEVRNKGTGFFAFSKDEEERKEQMEELEKERLETERVRGEKLNEKQERRKARERELEERRKAIRERKSKVQADRFLDKMSSELGGAGEGS